MESSTQLDAIFARQKANQSILDLKDGKTEKRSSPRPNEPTYYQEQVEGSEETVTGTIETARDAILEDPDMDPRHREAYLKIVARKYESNPNVINPLAKARNEIRLTEEMSALSKPVSSQPSPKPTFWQRLGLVRKQ